MAGKAWCFTQWDPEDLPQLEDYPDASYLVFSEELGANPDPEKTGYHLQGFVYFPAGKAKSLRQLNIMRPCHYEKARNAARAIGYCKKKDATFLAGPYEYGVAPAQGKRNDLLLIKDDIDRGGSTLALWDDHFSSMTRYHKSFSVYRSVKAAPRNYPPTILIFYGESGAGKTRAAVEEHADHYFLPTPKQSGVYWDSYSGQEAVIIDEMDGGYFRFKELLRLCDRYPYQCPVHGGAGLQFTSRTIIFTSSHPPTQWYPNISDEDFLQFRRRVTQVRRYRRDGGYELEAGWGHGALAAWDKEQAAKKDHAKGDAPVYESFAASYKPPPRTFDHLYNPSTYSAKGATARQQAPAAESTPPDAGTWAVTGIYKG